MIADIEKRRQVWNQRRLRGPDCGHDLFDSLPYPFETAGIQGIFQGSDTLEIGPGNGRQYERVEPYTKTYCVADLAPMALEEAVFLSVHKKFVLDDWSQSLGLVFDVIHFWYVLHHVRLDEMRDFFGFVSRHLCDGGLAAFNSPEPINVQGSPEGDGCGTTYSDPNVVRDAIEDLRLRVLAAVPVMRKSTGHVFLLQKSAGDK